MGLRLSFSLTSHYEKYLALNPGGLQHNSNSGHITYRVQIEEKIQEGLENRGSCDTLCNGKQHMKGLSVSNTDSVFSSPVFHLTCITDQGRTVSLVIHCVWRGGVGMGGGVEI